MSAVQNQFAILDESKFPTKAPGPTPVERTPRAKNLKTHAKRKARQEARAVASTPEVVPQESAPPTVSAVGYLLFDSDDEDGAVVGLAAGAQSSRMRNRAQVVESQFEVGFLPLKQTKSVVPSRTAATPKREEGPSRENRRPPVERRESDRTTTRNGRNGPQPQQRGEDRWIWRPARLNGDDFPDV
jgi:hypothetical protein